MSATSPLNQSDDQIGHQGSVRRVRQHRRFFIFKQTQSLYIPVYTSGMYRRTAKRTDRGGRNCRECLRPFAKCGWTQPLPTWQVRRRPCSVVRAASLPAIENRWPPFRASGATRPSTRTCQVGRHARSPRARSVGAARGNGRLPTISAPTVSEKTMGSLGRSLKKKQFRPAQGAAMPTDDPQLCIVH